MGVTFNILVLVVMVLVLLNIRNLLDVLPNIFRCLSFWRENVNIEDNISVMRIRNYYATLGSAILALILLRYKVMLPGFITQASAELQPMMTLGYVGAYLLMRLVMFKIMFGKLDNRSVFNAVHRAIFNYIIIAAILILASVWILSFAGVSDKAIGVVFIAEIGLAFLVLFTREMQILLSRCSGFGTFLYICTLEILPAGLMVAAAMLL